MSSAALAMNEEPQRAMRWVDLAPLEAVPLGQGRAFVLDDRTIAVFRQRDGRLYACDNQCPHRGGPLSEGILGAGTVICPLHSWKIRLEDGHCAAENASVRVYPITTVEGRIVVQMPGVD